MTKRIVVVAAAAERDALVELLRLQGYRAQAATAETWVQAAQHLQADIVLLDVLLPEVHGPAAALRLRALVPTAQLVLLSSEVAQ